jgi:NAD(P) transhydrogenase subunit beta
MSFLVIAAYLLASALFIYSLKWMSTPVTARRGVIAGVTAMVAAVVGTMMQPTVVNYNPIIIAMIAGAVVGVPISMVALTAVPQRTAISHAFGALAAALVGTAEFYLHHDSGLERFTMGAICFEVILGFLTFTGSIMAFLKLQEWIPTRPITFKNQNIANIGLLIVAVLIGAFMVYNPASAAGPYIFVVLALLALAFGVMLIMPIGGADMPTVISILNSYAGLAAVAMGFVLDNKLLIIAGALDGSSGLILSIIMCRAMNRSFVNVLFGAFGQVQASVASTEQKNYRSASADEAASILEVANSVVIVPGYGMAVAQAQHKVRELHDALTKRGIQVSFAIHPVAGRMPGHMNVLLAEADIPYDKLKEMDDINPDMPQTDVALIIGANDVTNPVARHDKSSPIYGMPIIDCDKARNVMVIKRSMNPGFAGIDNELYYMDKTMMLFGDAKSFVGDMVKALSAGSH